MADIEAKTPEKEDEEDSIFGRVVKGLKKFSAKEDERRKKESDQERAIDEKRLEVVGDTVKSLPERAADWLFRAQARNSGTEPTSRTEEETARIAARAKEMGPPGPDTMTKWEVAQMAEPPKQQELHEKVKTNMAQDPTKGMKNLDDLAAGVKELPAGRDRSEFANELKDLKSWYKQAQDRLDNKELIEKLAHAVTQMGAAWYGLKNGVDMSGLKFDKADWERKQDRMLNEFRTRLDELKDREHTAVQEEQFGKTFGLHKEDSARQSKQLQELIRHNKAMEANDSVATALKASVAGAKKGKDPNEDIKKASDKVRVIYRSKDLDDDEKRAQAVNVLATDLDMDAEQARQRLEGSGWFSSNNEQESMDVLTEMLKEWKYTRLSGGTPLAGSTSAAGQRMVKIKNKETGETIEVPASEVGQ